MKQLVQLKEHAAEFKNLNTELVFVFREEQEGVDGLKKIKEKFDPPYRLAVDLNKKNSGAYSPKRMTFNNYVIDSDGVVRGVIDGNLRTRAKAEQLTGILSKIQGESGGSK